MATGIVVPFHPLEFHQPRLQGVITQEFSINTLLRSLESSGEIFEIWRQS